MENQSYIKYIFPNDEYFPNWQIFFFLSIMNFMISFLANEFVFTREIYYHIFSEQMELGRIDKFIDKLNRFSVWSLLGIPLVLLIKYVVETFLLQLPLLLRFIEIPFKYIFRIVMYASIALIISRILHVLWIYWTPINELSGELFKIKPFSVGSLINSSQYPESSIAVFNQCSIFELLWGIILYCGLIKTGKIKKIDTALLVFCVWTVILFLQWMVYFFIMGIQ